MNTAFQPMSTGAPGSVPRKNGDRGSILGIVLVLVVVMTVLTVGLMSLTRFTAASAGTEVSTAQAFWAAEAGLEDAKAFAYSHLQNYADAGWTEPHVRGIGTAQYNVTIRELSSGSGGERIFTVTSVGTSMAGINKTVSLNISFWPYLSGLFGANLVEFSGNSVATGFVRSNGDINLVGNTQVIGDAIPGPGYVLTNAEAAKVTGSVDPAPEKFILEPVVLPGPPYQAVAPEFLDKSGNLSLTGNATLTLSQSGNYLFPGISLTSQSTIVIPPGVKVTVYCTGPVDTGGGAILNQGLNSDNFNLFITSTGTMVNLNLKGGSSFYGHVYAPNSDCTLTGGATFNGSIACGGTATLKGGSTFTQQGTAPGNRSLVWVGVWKQVY